ncbi:hypothetical protein FJTKL_12956 [Diaporthe vaccinii]|uniref:Uncharacterized protein n=1 Tax=Diaporthe vaccinii TaxID=105482 RepID=A0ABR4EC10_9PEZI
MVNAERDRDRGGRLVGGAFQDPIVRFRIPSFMMIMEVQLLGAANDHHWHIIIGTYPSPNIPRFSMENGFPL